MFSVSNCRIWRLSAVNVWRTQVSWNIFFIILAFEDSRDLLQCFQILIFWSETRSHYPERASALDFKDAAACDLVIAMQFFCLFLVTNIKTCCQAIISKNAIWHGGGAWWPPKMFLTTVLKRLGGGSWNLVIFNINLWKKVIFASLGYPVLP